MRKSELTIDTCSENAGKFELFLKKLGKTPNETTEDDINLFISEHLKKEDVSKFMWTLQYYFSFLKNQSLLKHVKCVRVEYIKKKRQPFKIKKFRGVNQESIKKLSAIDIQTVDDMLKAGRTKSMRKELSDKTGVPLDEILELAKLSDLSRLGAVKTVRARLYHDSGFDLIDKIAKVTAEELISRTRDFIEKSDFDGIPPTPKEAQDTVNSAKKTKRIIEL
jgi:site-specific recombinase XerD